MREKGTISDGDTESDIGGGLHTEDLKQVELNASRIKFDTTSDIGYTNHSCRFALRRKQMKQPKCLSACDESFRNKSKDCARNWRLQ